MQERLHRTQLLLEPEQHEALAEIARREGQSISKVVREMIAEQLERRQRATGAELKRQLEALEQIHQHREAILARRGGVPIDVAGLIDQMSEEQDERSVGDRIDRD